MADSMSIGELAQLTGVAAGTLRAWESRYGFPAADRSEGGQRRYGPHVVEQIQRVMAERAGGMVLTAAIAQAQGSTVEASLFALLRRRYPALSTHTMTKHQALALSRAIEDESASRGRQSVLVGAFQHARQYRVSRRRWESLARTSAVALVFADFADLSGLDRHPREIPIASDHPLTREWMIAVTGPQLAAGLVGWESPQPAARSNAVRRLEVLWSVERAQIHTLITAAAALAADVVPALAPLLPALPAAAPGAEDLAAATAVTNRMIGYLSDAS